MLWPFSTIRKLKDRCARLDDALKHQQNVSAERAKIITELCDEKARLAHALAKHTPTHWPSVNAQGLAASINSYGND